MTATRTQRFSARIFISHTHWDHINTMPFFAPLYVRGNQIEVFGPYQGDLTIERAISAQMESVYFPVTIREFGARLTVPRPARGERWSSARCGSRPCCSATRATAWATS